MSDAAGAAGGWRPPVPQPLTLAGPAGALEALLESPAAEAARFGVICHPHPLFGGTMHNKVVHTLARSLQQLGVPTLRFNFRGVGASAGTHDEGRGETDDTEAVIAWGRERWPRARLVLAGFSFGAMIALRVAQRQTAERLITVAPAVDRLPVDELHSPTCPWLLVQGADDEVVATDKVLRFAGHMLPPPVVKLLPGTGHFFHGRLLALQEEVHRFMAGTA